MQAILKVLILFIVVLLAVSYSEDLDAKTNYASFSAEDVIITPSVSASAAHSWQDTASHDSCKLSNRRNEGSAKRISGNIYILSIFISDKPWDKIGIVAK